MGQDDVQDRLNYADKSDLNEIDIMLHYWKQSNDMLMVRVTGWYIQSDDFVKAEYVKVDYTETLALYMIRSCIGVKSSW